MTSFQYRGFYDYPRIVALRQRGKLFLLECLFDDELDEYPDVYTVYLLPPSAEEELNGASWEFLEDTQRDPIGQIPIEKVPFDSTKGKELGAAILDKLAL